MKIEKKEKDKILAFCKSEYPKEAGGYIAGGKFVVCENIADEPEKFYQCKEKVSKKWQAFIHSHTNGNFYPSKKDMVTQQALGIECGIVDVGYFCSNKVEARGFVWWGGKKVEPLEGRHFISGVFDCYSMVRDFYKKKLKVKLNDFPRDCTWWKNGENLILENFENENFFEVSPNKAKKNDVFIFTIGGGVANHLAIFLGDGKIIHHLKDKVSCMEDVARFVPYLTKVVRFKGNDD